jgi:hypothetical protein
VLHEQLVGFLGTHVEVENTCRGIWRHEPIPQLVRIESVIVLKVHIKKVCDLMCRLIGRVQFLRRIEQMQGLSLSFKVDYYALLVVVMFLLFSYLV